MKNFILRFMLVAGLSTGVTAEESKITAILNNVLDNTVRVPVTNDNVVLSVSPFKRADGTVYGIEAFMIRKGNLWVVTKQNFSNQEVHASVVYHSYFNSGGQEIINQCKKENAQFLNKENEHIQKEKEQILKAEYSLNRSINTAMLSATITAIVVCVYAYQQYNKKNVPEAEVEKD